MVFETYILESFSPITISPSSLIVRGPQRLRQHSLPRQEPAATVGRRSCRESYVEAEALHFLHQHVEATRGCRPPACCAPLTIRFVDAWCGPLTSSDLDREEFLQRVGSAVGFDAPRLPFRRSAGRRTGPCRPTAAASRASTDRRRGRESCPRHEVIQLQHVDVADHDALVERFAGAPVVEGGLLPASGRPAFFIASLDLALDDAVEHR